MRGKKVSIFTGNHLTTGISDQLDYLIFILNKYGIEATTSTRLSNDVPNILIENFTNYEVFLIEKFKNENKNAELFCIVTEHFELKDGNLFLNEERFDSARTYIPNLYERFINFFRLSHYFSGIITLQGLPKKDYIQEIFLQHKIFNFSGLPLPSDIKNRSRDKIEYEYDLCFFGKLTEHRQSILDKLKRKYRIYVGYEVAPKARNRVLMKTRYNINIAQSENWTNVSTMRVFSSSKLGVSTINLSKLSDNNVPGLINMRLEDLMENGLPSSRKTTKLKTIKNSRKIVNNFCLDGFELWID